MRPRTFFFAAIVDTPNATITHRLLSWMPCHGGGSERPVSGGQRTAAGSRALAVAAGCEVVTAAAVDAGDPRAGRAGATAGERRAVRSAEAAGPAAKQDGDAGIAGRNHQ